MDCLYRFHHRLFLAGMAGLLGLNASCSDAARRRQVAEQARVQAIVAQQLAQQRQDQSAQNKAEQAASNRAAAAPVGPISDQDATSLMVVAVGPGEGFRGFKTLTVEVMESMPVQFAVPVQSLAPFELVLDQLSELSKQGVFVASVHFARRGDGTAPKPVAARLALGSLKVGNYRLEIHLAPAPGEPHAKVQIFALSAR